MKEHNIKFMYEYAEPDGRREVDQDRWPYEDDIRVYAVDGELAERVQKIAGSEEPVTLKTRTIYGGWSEMTQENDYEFELMCGEQVLFVTSKWSMENNLTLLLEWLKENERT